MKQASARTNDAVANAYAPQLLHMYGWHKVYADDIATIHVRKPGAAHTAEPVVRTKAN